MLNMVFDTTTQQETLNIEYPPTLVHHTKYLHFTSSFSYIDHLLGSKDLGLNV